MPIQVEQYEFGRYYFTAESGETHLIDIKEFDGNGFCSCRDFQYRHLPTLVREQEAGRPYSANKQCKHIKALLLHLDASNPTTESVTPIKEDMDTVQPEEE